MAKSIFNWAGIVLLAVCFTGCVASRSELTDTYRGPLKKNLDAKPASVLFAFTHVQQSLGYDAVPKTVEKHESIDDFDQLFAHSLRELSNVGKYETFTDEISDVNSPARRLKKDSLKAASDYTIAIRIVAEKHFAPHFLGTLVSVVSLTVIPVPYRQHYRMETEIRTRDGRLVGSYQRSASLSKWVESLLLFAYPFYPEKQKREEIFVSMLNDTFRQIESEGVLKAQ